MSLNWKEINLILSELDLEGFQIQKAIQTAYDVLALKLHGKGETKTLLIALTPGGCRLHETFRGVPKNDKPLRFAEFLNSRIVNGWIEEAVQLGDNRIIRLVIHLGVHHYRLYLRLWSNAANLVVTDKDGAVLDAMRRLPKRGEISGGRYAPEETFTEEKRDSPREYEIRELPGEGSFNEKIDLWYAEHGAALSLDSLREQARKTFEGSIGRLRASLERLRTKEADYAAAERLKEYGDIILSNTASIKNGDSWLEAENFYTGDSIRIKLDPKKSPSAQAESYYEQYRKAKNGLEEIQSEIASGEQELNRLETTLTMLLTEKNPFALHKLLKTGGVKPQGGVQTREADRKRPGLSFRRKDWLIIVGRDAAENDALLRGHVKGKDLWLHARDYPGSYVFIKQRSGKTVPLEILLDAGNLAVFYSKARNNGEADLFYTQVKFLRRAKNGPKGLVIPTQEKNIHIKADAKRLKELETCRIEK
ncbi:MAG: NFACT family protein [Treponema sp.]|jgi:predicted ribosome quality control (RQC) complex YloA/Tae2 family protein|nr:NFACT family protein [Treponema sp.]